MTREDGRKKGRHPAVRRWGMLVHWAGQLGKANEHDTAWKGHHAARRKARANRG